MPSVYRAPGEEQTAEKLAGFRRVHNDLAAGQLRIASESERQRVAVAVDPGTNVLERTKQRSHGPRVRLLVAVEPHCAMSQSGDRWHETHHRSGQAAIDRAVSDKTLRWGDLPLAPWLIGVVLDDVDAEGTQRVSHQLGVTRL